MNSQAGACRAGTDAISSSGAIRRAGLDCWKVPLIPVRAQKFDGRWEEVAGRQALLRSRDTPVLGMVTDAYAVIPQEEAGGNGAPLQKKALETLAVSE